MTEAIGFAIFIVFISMSVLLYFIVGLQNKVKNIEEQISINHDCFLHHNGIRFDEIQNIWEWLADKEYYDHVFMESDLYFINPYLTAIK